MFPGEAQYAEGTADLDSLASRGFDTAVLIHQQQINMAFDSQSDRLRVCRAKIGDRIWRNAVPDFHPWREPSGYGQDYLSNSYGRISMCSIRIR
jgi:hypothetical protein